MPRFRLRTLLIALPLIVASAITLGIGIAVWGRETWDYFVYVSRL